MTMLDTSETRSVGRPPIPRAPLIGGLMLAGLLITAACSDADDTDQADPAGVLSDYQEARNSGDIDALMAFYADNAVVTNHPRDPISTGEDEPVATGVDEIRALESPRPSFRRRPEDATEFINVQVSGNRVTFDQTFFTDEGECFGDSGNEVTLEDGKITRYAWGTDDSSLCE